MRLRQVKLQGILKQQQVTHSLGVILIGGLNLHFQLVMFVG
jgi:hypothetical protein